MTGWIGDFVRFWWALFYWNSRKTWFRLRGAHRDSCPCQNYGDSGLAFDSRCDAVVHWHKPARFRRVCPLLQEIPAGWRCAVDAERVRPFWGRAAGYVGVVLLVVYLAGTIATFATLRLAGYEVSYVALLWPPRWDEVRVAQEKLYAVRAQQALVAGRYQEAILALEMVCQLNPRNYPAGLALANLSQLAAHPVVAEQIYVRLMRDVPEQRIPTAQILCRNLLARSAYDQIKPLAATMLEEDASQRGAWLNALLFAARQTGDSEYLTTVLTQRSALPDWCLELIMIERDLLQSHLNVALPRLTRFHPQPADAYVPYYQVDRLSRLGRTDEALTLLNKYGTLLPDDEAAFLRLHLFRVKGWRSLLDGEYDNLLQHPVTPRHAAQFCASLLSEPDPVLLARYFDKFTREGPPLASDTLPLYEAIYLAAALSSDQGRAEKMLTQIKEFTSSDARAVQELAALLKTRQPAGRLELILPLIPLPIEVLYAVQESPSAPFAK